MDRREMMRRLMRYILLFPMGLAGVHHAAASSKQTRKRKAAEALSKTHWLGHASFRIDVEDIVVYLDPWQIPDGPKADLILITHDHHDHCSPKDVAKIRKDDTTIVTVPAATAKLSGSVETIAPGDEITVKGLRVSAVPAYNINKFRSSGVAFHPIEKAYVGFVFDVGGQRFYHAGDTDCIPEMKSLEADIALLPVSGTYVMTAEEAVEAVKKIEPQVAVPMHIGRGIGSLGDADAFKQKAPDVAHVLPFEK
ncbi:MAG: MBL fold metallo-hydrolase [Candidatus Latescibacteria bacterium]|nr:MBL fold metallo-hydrolase [Candidatus Latescibacterota bacterium]